MRAAAIASVLLFLAPVALSAQRVVARATVRHAPVKASIVYAPPPVPAYGRAVILRYPRRAAVCVNAVGVVHSHRSTEWWERSGYREVRIWYNTGRREYCAEARGSFWGLRDVRAYEWGGSYVIPEREH